MLEKQVLQSFNEFGLCGQVLAPNMGCRNSKLSIELVFFRDARLRTWVMPTVVFIQKPCIGESLHKLLYGMAPWIYCPKHVYFHGRLSSV